MPDDRFTSAGEQGSAERSRSATERMKLVESIYFAVAPLAPGDRDAAIAGLSGGDASIEGEVRGLVASASRLGSFLDHPALGRGIDQLAAESDVGEPHDPLIGATLGAFRIVHRVASGGMGTVYRAARVDGQFEQTVAIKVVKRGLDSEQIVQRFAAERRTLAGLDHGYIARLLDGGVAPDGRPFLVMEYVDGLPIDEYCDRRGLKVRQRLELFAEVCKAVHHAHQNLVIHRDLKPSNILVTPQGVPKLLDFGIAKVLTGDGAAADVTADADRRLTPEYASPEQVGGQLITTASDVYSLGVVLYEILTGARPYRFTSRSTEELRRIVCGTMPPAPSAAVTTRATGAGAIPLSDGAGHALDRKPDSPEDIARTRGVSTTRLRSLLRGDLDNLVLMALRKEPRRRYASAEQFAQDIRRFLDGMPVQARQDTTLYRASKFVRRHAVSVAFASSGAVLLTAASIVLFVQATQLTRQRDELLASNRRLDQTRRYMQAILGGAETGNQGPDARLGTVLRDAIDALRTNPPEDPLTRAAAEHALGRSVMSLGMLGDARDLLERAQKTFDSLPPDSPTRADLRLDLAELLFFEGKHAEARSIFEDLLRVERARDAGSRSEREGLILNDLGACLRAQGNTAAAAETQREAIAVRIEVFGEKSLAVAESQNNLGSALFQLGRIDEAIEQFERSLATRRSLLRVNHPLIVRAESNLGLVLLRGGRALEAVQVLVSAADAWESAFGSEHAGRVATTTSLSQALRSLKRFDEAIRRLEEILVWQRARQAQDSPQVAATIANIGIALAESGDDARARERLERSLPIISGAGGSFAGITKAATLALADLYSRAGEEARAAALRATLDPAAK